MSELVLEKNEQTLAAPKNKKTKLSNRTREIIAGLLFVSPWIIGFAIFGIYPIIKSFMLSFSVVTDVTEFTLESVGFENYKYAFSQSSNMLSLLEEFLADKLFMVFIINVFALLFAVLLNGDIKFRGFFRTIFFLPVVVVSGPVMEQLLTRGVITVPNISDFQIINVLGATFGETLQKFIVDTFSGLIEMFWFSGVQLIVYLTMLQKMDKSMYEASNIDGASVWESFWKITLPGLKPAILINVIYTLILLATFDNNPLIKLILDEMWTPGMVFGYSAAMAWIYFAILLVLVLIIVLVLYGLGSHKEKKYVAGEAYVYNQTRYLPKTGFLYTNHKVKKIKKKILGKNFSDGILARIFVYTILIVMSFAFLYPFVFMILKGFQSPSDVVNEAIELLPSSFYIENWVKAFEVLDFWKSLGTSVLYAGIPTLLQVASCAVVGYGLAKFTFPGKKVIFGLVILAFLIPPQILMLPTYIMYTKMELLGSILTFALPAALGQGIKSTIFIMLFFAFFSMLPKELDEAAEIDGASKLGIFFRVAIPLSIPMFIVGLIFSFVWYWNETYLTTLYMGEEVTTMPMQLRGFEDLFNQWASSDAGSGSSGMGGINDSIYMAGTVISILPLLIFYFVLQRWFVEGIDKAGLTGQ